MRYRKSLIFICFYLLGQAAYGTEESGSETPCFATAMSSYKNARTYDREGEEWKRRDARLQFSSIFDSYILQYGIVERITKRVLIQGKMVPKSYTFAQCFIVSMEC